jgi:hypothetical protein
VSITRESKVRKNSFLKICFLIFGICFLKYKQLTEATRMKRRAKSAYLKNSRRKHSIGEFKTEALNCPQIPGIRHGSV